MNAERILGSLVREALGGGSRGKRSQRGRGGMVPAGMKGMLGMGALGVAIAAFDHFARQQKGGAQAFGGPPPPSAPPAQPFTGSPQPVSPSGAYPPPPPPPGSSLRATPPPPPPPPAATAADEALLMVRAMIAAANADHELDAEERERIVRALDESGASAEDRRALLDELERPLDLATLAARATTPALKRDVYLASEMAIVADTRAEQNYLARLAKQLALDAAQVEELRKILSDASSGE